MKKILAIIITGILCLSVVSCAYNRPAGEVDRVLEGFKNYDKDIISEYSDNKYVSFLVNSSGDKKVSEKIYKNIFKNLSYDIMSTDKSGDEATVKVKVTNVNFNNIYKEYSDSSYDYIIDHLYSGKLNKKNLNAKCLQILSEEVDKIIKDKDNKDITKEIEIKLKKNENGFYRIVFDKKTVDALSGGFIQSMSRIVDK